MFRFGPTSMSRLQGVHPDLIRVAVLGLEYSTYDFTVTEGVRSMDRQIKLKAAGLSMTLNSKHLVQPDGYGHALDVMAVGDLNKDGIADAQDKQWTWRPEIYSAIATAMKRAAAELKIGIRWGGDFKTRDGRPFFDGPHFELL